MKVNSGQIIVGALTEGGANRIWAVKGISKLQSGDRKAWIVGWDPGIHLSAEERDDDGVLTEATVRFPGGEVTNGWRVLDFYNPAGMIDRAAKTIELHSKSKAPDELALAVLRAMFAGPPPEE